MVRVNEIRAAMARKGLSQRQVAMEIGVTERTFYNKMQKGVFMSDEIEKLIVVLEIQDPIEVFFAKR